MQTDSAAIINTSRFLERKEKPERFIDVFFNGGLALMIAAARRLLFGSESFPKSVQKRYQA